MMKEKSIPCNECFESVHLTEEKIKELTENALGLNIPTVNEDLYKKRIDVCKACESFVYETTCMKCGCIVSIRALLANKRCPHNDGDRWLF